jgi:hypothetical protein
MLKLCGTLFSQSRVACSLLALFKAAWRMTAMYMLLYCFVLFLQAAGASKLPA